MKKVLLFAVAAIIAGTASAQLLKKQNLGKPQTRHQVQQFQAAPWKAPIADGVKANVKATVDKSCKTFKMTAAQKQAVKSAGRFAQSSQSSFRRAGQVQPLYNGFGKLRSTSELVNWEMLSGVDEEQGVAVLKDVIPNIFGFEGGVVVEYTVVDGSIVIAPQLVASFPSESAPTGTYYIFLEDALSDDGKITLTMEEDGSIAGTYSIIYSVYPAATYNFDDWVGTYDGINGCQYNLPGVVKAPVVSFEQSNLVLFAGLGINGYSYNYNLAMTGAYANTNFANLTMTPATGWNWTAYDAMEEEPVVYASATTQNLSLPTEDMPFYNLTLIGQNEDKVSEPFVYGAGRAKDEDGVTPIYDTCFIFAGGDTDNSFSFEDGTPATMSRYNLDNDLALYQNWATPDIYTTSMSKIFNLFQKPATPLYIEGVTLPLYGFAELDPVGNPFHLHVKICKVDRSSGVVRPGEVIAEGDATKENVNDEFAATSSITGIDFNDLYVEDEFGMATQVPYLFLDDEFFVIVEGWDNGSFTGRFFSEDEPLEDFSTATWFEKSDEPGKMYSYTSWKTALMVGLMGATYGYLQTADDTHMVIPVEGGEASITVHPLLSNGDEAAATLGYKTRLWLDETIEGNEIPEWLQIGFANEDYDVNYTFDLVAQADALPSGVEGREATLVFMQEGARLTVTVTQGATGINATKASVKVEKTTPMYNLAGQRVNSSFKGLVIKDGKKVVIK